MTPSRVSRTSGFRCPQKADEVRFAVAEIAPRILEFFGALIEQFGGLREPAHHGGLMLAEMSRNDVHRRPGLSRPRWHVEHYFVRRIRECIPDAIGGCALVIEQRITGRYPA